jgi:drug/metabolite transporter (DMT)-like permease
LYRIGLVLAVLAGVSLGSGNVLRKLGVTHYSQPLIGVTIGSLTALLVMLVVFAWQQRLVEVVRKVPSMLRGGGYLWTGVLTSLALYTTFTALLFSPVSIVNSIKATEPLFTIAGSLFFLKTHEVLTFRFIRYALLIMAGVILIFIYT